MIENFQKKNEIKKKKNEVYHLISFSVMKVTITVINNQQDDLYFNSTYLQQINGNSWNKIKKRKQANKRYIVN